MNPLRKVIDSHYRSGQSIFASFTIRWWDLQLECGHSVERRMRFPKQVGRAIRGYAIMHHPRKHGEELPPPGRVRCEFCSSSTERCGKVVVQTDGSEIGFIQRSMMLGTAAQLKISSSRCWHDTLSTPVPPHLRQKNMPQSPPSETETGSKTTFSESIVDLGHSHTPVILT